MFRQGVVAPTAFRLANIASVLSAYNMYKEAEEYFDLDLEAGRKYQARANLQGISFVFHFVDITDGRETKLSDARVKVTAQKD